MKFGKFSLAALVAASLICAPVMARSLDSPDFTEKIEQKAPVTNAPAADAPNGTPSDGMIIVRFDPRMVQYAVLPPVIKQTPIAFDATFFEYAATVDSPVLARIGSLYRSSDTT